MLIARLMLIVLSLVSVVSCRPGTVSHDEFDRSCRSYNRMIRWQEYETAGSMFLAEAIKGTFTSRISDLRKVNIVDYRIAGIEFDEVKGTAVVRTEFDYYLLPSPAVKKVVDTQSWRYSALDKRWYLESLLPDFR